MVRYAQKQPYLILRLTLKIKLASRDITLGLLLVNKLGEHGDFPVPKSLERRPGKQQLHQYSYRMTCSRYLPPLEVFSLIEENLVNIEIHDDLVVTEGNDLRSTELQVEVVVAVGKGPCAPILDEGVGSTLPSGLRSRQAGRLRPQIAVDPFDGNPMHFLEIGREVCGLGEVNIRALTLIVEVRKG